jgi:hypothetical protein
MTRYRHPWVLGELNLMYQTVGAEHPVLTAVIVGGPEAGRRVVAGIDPVQIRDMAQALIDEAEHE